MSAPLANAEARRDAAVDWLMGRINYERVAVVPYNERQLKLDRMRQLLTRVGSPDAGLRIVHIAGTKGKGSTAALLAGVLTAAGYRTGVYSSPHLERIEERWAIDGEPCPAEDLARMVEQIRPVVAEMDDEAATADPRGGAASVGPPTFFDITTAIALVYFAEQQCDAVVLEVGLGGRLDSTNVCLPCVSVITSISLDHTRQLGDTLAAIAGEKAGVIKPGVPVVSGVVEPEPRAVIARIARERGCRLIERGVDFDARGDGPCDFWRDTPGGREQLAQVSPGLVGPHQVANAAAALAVVGELRDQGWKIADDACRAGLAAARLPARVEWFAASGERPAVVVDTAHNEASARALVESLPPRYARGQRTLVVAISRDKQIDAITRALAPHFERFVVTRFVDNPRALPPDDLAERLQAAGVEPAQIATVATPAEAFKRALESTPADGLIVVSGSFFIAAELRPLVRGGGG